MGDDLVDCYVIRHTDKATYVHVRRTEEDIWIPKSVITASIEKPLEPGDEYLFPEGRPAVFRVAAWFLRKYHIKLRGLL
jgi:hypothetical protein